MAVTVVDGSNLEQVMADAGVAEAETKADKPAEKAAAKPADKPTDKEAKPDEADDADDVEGDDGLTQRQKRELSGKMLKAIGKKHRQVKEAEEFAAHQIREKTEAERRATEAEERARQLEAQLRPVKEEVEPTREAFSTEGDYIDAKIKWGVDQGIKQRDMEREALAMQKSVEQQYARAVEMVPDFEEATSKQLNYPRGVATYMRDSDMFAELGYHFAKNPQSLEKLASLAPMRQLVELGKIEATLRPFGSSASSPKADDKSDDDKSSTVDTGFSPSKARSDAPVISPLTGSEGSVEPDVRTMGIRQSIEHFQKTNKVNLHARKRH